MKKYYVIIGILLTVIIIVSLSFILNNRNKVKNWEKLPINSFAMTTIGLSTKWENKYMLLKIAIDYSNTDSLPGWYETEPLNNEGQNLKNIVLELVFYDKDGFEKLRYKINENQLESNKIWDKQNKLIGFEINDKKKLKYKEYLLLEKWQIHR